MELNDVLRKYNYQGWDGWNAPRIQEAHIAIAQELWDKIAEAGIEPPTLGAQRFRIIFEWEKPPLYVQVDIWDSDPFYLCSFYTEETEQEVEVTTNCVERVLALLKQHVSLLHTI